MKTSIKVLELIFDFQVGGKGGGIGRFAIELIRTLDSQKFERYLGGLFDRGTPLEKQWVEQLKSENITAFIIGSWSEVNPYLSFLKATFFLWRWQSENKADIIHSHSEFTDMAALLLKFHPSKPIIIRSVHYGFQYEWRKRPLRRFLLTNLSYPLLYDLEIGVSQAITKNLNQRYLAQLLKKHALCIHNAIDVSRFQTDNLNKNFNRTNLGIPENALLIGAIGRLTEQKGFYYLIDAAALVLERFPSAYFLIVGDGELLDTLKNHVFRLGINQNLQFTGSRTDIEQIFGSLDLFVSSSLWEGLPTVIMESMASGTAVVATDIPGSRELIQVGQTGWLAIAGNSQDLATKIGEALTSPKLREIYAKHAKEKVQSFTIKSITSRHEKLYSLLLRKSTIYDSDLPPKN